MPRLLDLFCGAGGAARGYADAGFAVVGVDIRPQPNFPFEFIQSDVLDLDPEYLASFDAIHASPPCQRYSTATPKWKKDDHPDMIRPVRELMRAAGRPYVIENVAGAPIHKSLMLCGTMFPPLRVVRHRYFETNVLIPQPQCKLPHPRTYWYRNKGRQPREAIEREFEVFIANAGNNARIANARDAMGIPWMTGREIREAIPPAFTHYIGSYLLMVV